MKNVLITNQILTGNLFQENGYDEYVSAKRLKNIMEKIYREQAAADYPGADIEVSIEIVRAAGYSKPLEIVVTETEDDEFVEFPDTHWYQSQCDKIEFDEWAVEAVNA